MQKLRDFEWRVISFRESLQNKVRKNSGKHTFLSPTVTLVLIQNSMNKGTNRMVNPFFLPAYDFLFQSIGRRKKYKIKMEMISTHNKTKWNKRGERKYNCGNERNKGGNANPTKDIKTGRWKTKQDWTWKPWQWETMAYKEAIKNQNKTELWRNKNKESAEKKIFTRNRTPPPSEFFQLWESRVNFELVVIIYYSLL